MISEIEVFIIHTCMNKIRIQNPLQILICVNPLYPLKSACYSLFNYDNAILTT